MTAERQADSDARYDLSANRPVWQVLAHAPLERLTGTRAIPAYVIVWIADDVDEADGDPLHDSNGVLMLRAEAFGLRGARRRIDVSLAHEPARRDRAESRREHGEENRGPNDQLASAMTETAIICQACGAKVRDTHTRCPRCRAILMKLPAVEAPSSDLAGKVVAGVLALAVVATLAILWTSRAEPEAPSAPVKSGDPVGGRHRPEPGRATVAQAPTGDVPVDPAFAVSFRLSQSTDTADEAALERLRTTIARDPQDAESLAGVGRCCWLWAVRARRCSR